MPIDLELGSLRALVISGPNTGGKTVALKTLGLAAALHQCGLRPPADEAALPVFDEILVDIGDEQSIAMSLSTFSAHVRNLIGILEMATEHSLVLLDEIAAGTDPVEGAALAEALLGRLADAGAADGDDEPLRRAEGVGERRRRAPRTPPPAIDSDSDEPLYTVTLGRPGTSHALQTAERLGLPAPIVAAAREQDRARAAARRRARRRSRDGRPGGAGGSRRGVRGAAGRRGGATVGRSAPSGCSGRDRAGAVVGRCRAAARTGAGRGGARRRYGRSSRSCVPRSVPRAGSSASAAGPRPRLRRRRSGSATAGWAPPPTGPPLCSGRSRGSTSRCR